MRIQLLVVCALLLALLAGCGGGTPARLTSRATGRATLTVLWPAPSRLSAMSSQGRLIPAATNSIVAQIKNGTTVVASQTLPRSAGSASATATFNNLPSGNLTVAAAAYASGDGTGVPLAQASTALVITAGQNTPFSLTLASAIDHLELTPASPAVPIAQRLQLTATAKDAAGSVVMLAPSTLRWTSSSQNVALVDSTGVVSGLALGTSTITVSDTESGKSVSVTLTVQPAVGLVSWFRAENNANDSAGSNNGTTAGNVTYTSGVLGQAFAFDGNSGTVMIPDAENLKITGSLTIDARVFVKALPAASKGFNMIVFRGDQRFGFDPYFMGIQPDGTIAFTVQQDTSSTGSSSVTSAITLNKWVHVTASLDGNSGVQSLFLDGQLASRKTTSVRPLRDLDSSQLPGVAIGNSSGYPQGIFNYTFNGNIDEVKIYNSVVAPGP